MSRSSRAIAPGTGSFDNKQNDVALPLVFDNVDQLEDVFDMEYIAGFHISKFVCIRIRRQTAWHHHVRACWRQANLDAGLGGGCRLLGDTPAVLVIFKKLKCYGR